MQNEARGTQEKEVFGWGIWAKVLRLNNKPIHTGISIDCARDSHQDRDSSVRFFTPVASPCEAGNQSVLSSRRNCLRNRCGTSNRRGMRR